MQPQGFTSFTCRCKETDLHISVDEESFTPDVAALAEQRVFFYRQQLESYLSTDPVFGSTLQPHLAAPPVPPLALAMLRAGNVAGVGPMAAVAGAFAEFVGRDLLKLVKQVIVENGGDIFITTEAPVTIAIFAGASPFSNRLALELPPSPSGLGICTSSGTVGPSLSLGRADAAVIVAPSAPLADAAATACANLVQKPADVEKAVHHAFTIPGVAGALVIKGSKLAARGDLSLIRL